MAQGCTTRQAELILYAELTAKRQSSHRLVFTDIFVTYDFYRDPSLLLRMTSGRREGKHVTQSNIYRLSSILIASHTRWDFNIHRLFTAYGQPDNKKAPLCAD